MNRRGFLGSILALAAAPAIVRAESLMAVRPIQIATVDEMFRTNSVLFDAMPIVGNRLLNISQITKESLLILESELTQAEKVSDQFNERFLLSELNKTVNRISVKRPAQFMGVTA